MKERTPLSLDAINLIENNGMDIRTSPEIVARLPAFAQDEHARILILDDEPYIAKILLTWLSAEGYECTSSHSARDALAQLEQGDFALLISDIVMPEKSGLDLLTEVNERFPAVAVLMMTGAGDRETGIRALKLGAYGYFTKPFNQDEILISVVSALERRRLLLASQKYERRLEEEVRQQTAEVRRREEEIAVRLVSASEFRDEETGAHIRRIGLYVSVLAQALGWSEHDSHDLRLAGRMHDIGKIGVPDSILLKPGKLSKEEFDIVKRHTLIGCDILDGSDIPALQMARDIALSHHEKWDGTGYPNGLEGDEIPESARLVAITDVYDALVHKRVYRDALTEREALAIMSNGKGKHFDPVMFQCFLEVLPDFRSIRREVAEEEANSKLRAIASSCSSEDKCSENTDR